MTTQPPIIHLPNLLPRWSCSQMVEFLPLRQYQATMYGQTRDRPRMEAWFHDNPDRTYRFGGGNPIAPFPFRGLLAQLRHDVNRITSRFLERETRFDSCFANLYRSGADSIGYHADDEPWIGPIITSVTLGAPRKFLLRPQVRETGARVRTAITLSHGDVLIMLPGCQDHWEHSIPKTKKAVGQRLNLTFRQTVK